MLVGIQDGYTNGTKVKGLRYQNKNRNKKIIRTNLDLFILTNF
jgi:hypothetical protein